MANATQVGSGAVTGATGAGGNNSSLAIKNTSKNHFWETLIQNIKDILHETDKILPEGSSETVVQQVNAASSTGTGVQPVGGKKTVPKGGIEDSPNPVSVQEGGTTVTRRNTFREAASVIPNPENGIITVRATGKQHEKIQEFVDRIMASARRQVLIEMTVVEVILNDQYQQGINWSKLLQASATKGFSLGQAGTPILPSTPTATPATFILNYTNPTSKFGSLSGSISLLETFGDIKVLSSPKLSVMNNQTAMLRVVENYVYFTMKADTTSNQTTTTTTFTTTPNTVPVGFTMSVTPQISENDTVLFNIRPSITRFIKMIPDPNPELKKVNATSEIPQTQTREMESIIKIESNQIAVMGGLMQDEVNNQTSGIPGASDIPVAGSLFKSRNEKTTKTELVIFLRPVVIKDASTTGDFSAYRDMLPDQDFFKESSPANTEKP